MKIDNFHEFPNVMESGTNSRQILLQNAKFSPIKTNLLYMVDDQQCSKSNLTSLTMNCMINIPSMSALTGQQSCHNFADEYLCVSCNGNSMNSTADIIMIINLHEGVVSYYVVDWLLVLHPIGLY